MADRDVEEHRAEITRQNRTTPTVVLVVLVCAVVAVFVTSSGDDSTDPAPAPTSSVVPTTARPAPVTATTTRTSPTTTPPPGTPPALTGIAVAADRLYVFGPRGPGRMGATVARDLALGEVTAAIAVGDDLAVLGPEGSLLVGREGVPFRPVACCYTDLFASNEDGDVWGVEGTQRAALVDLTAGPTGTTIDLGGDVVAGLGPFGLVTIDGAGQATWRRPIFSPSPIPVPDGRVALSSGGDLVASTVPAEETIEVRRIEDGSLVQAIPVPDPSEPVRWVVLSTAGDALAVAQPTLTTVFALDGTANMSRFEGGGQRPVAIGGGRFVAIVDGVMVDALGPVSFAAEPLVIATRAE